MTTLVDLIKYSEAKNLESEIYGICDSLRWNHENIDDDHISWKLGITIEFGFEFKPNVWYWFDAIVFEEDGSDLTMQIDMSFNQRYNRANGVMQKGFRRGWECENKIKEFFV